MEDSSHNSIKEQSSNNIQTSKKREDIPSAFALLRESWHVLQSRIGLFSAIIAIAVVGSIGSFFLQIHNTTNTLYEGFSFIFFVPVIFNIVFSLFITISLIYAVHLRNEKHADIGVLFKLSFRNFLPYFWVVFLVGIFSFAGFLALIIPGIMVSVMLILAANAVIIEKKRGLGALKRSMELVKGFWWSVAWRLVFLAIINFVIAFPLSLLITSIGIVGLEGIDLTYAATFIAAASSILKWVLAAVGVIYLYLLYEQLREVKDRVPSAVSTMSKKMIAGVVAVVLIPVIGIIVGITLVSVGSGNDFVHDARREVDIRQIGSAAEIFYQANERYPVSIEEIESELIIYPVDPVTKKPYEYISESGGTDYRACAETKKGLYCSTSTGAGYNINQ